MTAALDIEPRPILGINVIRLRDGREFRVEDIATAEQGRLILAEVDASILAIEDQIDHVDRTSQSGRDWLKRAERALKVKRRQRPAIQARTGELSRVEKAAAKAAAMGREVVRVDAKRKAFVHAAYELLGHEACTEVWAHAQEKQPALFADGKRPDA